MTETAFQPDAFQNDAFQVGIVTVILGAVPLPYPFKFDRTPHGVPIATAVFARRASTPADRSPIGANQSRANFGRRASAGIQRVFKRRGRGEDQDGTTSLT